MCILCLALRAARASADDPPVVTASQGRITGTKLQFRPPGRPELDRDVDAYLGIPYGEPPVGPLRFKPPVAKSWSGELQATKLGNRCPQPKVPYGNLVISGPFDEDCLSIDVVVPRPAVSVIFSGVDLWHGDEVISQQALHAWHENLSPCTSTDSFQICKGQLTKDIFVTTAADVSMQKVKKFVENANSRPLWLVVQLYALIEHYSYVLPAATIGKVVTSCMQRPPGSY